MKLSIFREAFLIVLLGLAPGMPADECPKCDCSHFPISNPDCVKCCFTRKGTVASASDTSITLIPESSKENPKPTTFQLEKSTKVNGKLKEGTDATVYYHVKQGQNVATRVDAVGYLEGLLVPVSEGPPSPGACDVLRKVPPDAMRILLGSSEAYSVSDKATVWDVGGEDILVFQRTERGLSVTAKVLNATGEIVAYIVDNHFFVNVNDSYVIKTPNNHTLVVIDKEGNQVFSIEFLDPHSVKVLGTFFGPHGERILVSEGQMEIGPIRVAGSCFGGGRIIRMD